MSYSEIKKMLGNIAVFDKKPCDKLTIKFVSALRKYLHSNSLHSEYFQFINKFIANVDKHENFCVINDNGEEQFFPATAQGASDAMNTLPLRGGAFGRNMMAPAKRRLIKSINIDEMDRDTGKEYSNIVQLLQDIGGGGDGKELIRLAATTNAPGQSGYQHLVDYYGLPENTEIQQRIDAFFSVLTELPTEYLEAKITHPVMLDEFAAAAVPANVNQEDIKILKDYGLNIVTYNPEVHGDQNAKITETAEKSDTPVFVPTRFLSQYCWFCLLLFPA